MAWWNKIFKAESAITSPGPSPAPLMNPNDPPAGPDAPSNARRALMKRFAEEWTASAQYLLNSDFDFNPDDLVQSKGKTVQVYQDMTRDPYVKAGMDIKKLSMCRLPVAVVPASLEKRDVEIAEFVEHAIEEMDTDWYTLLWGILDFVNCGYSIAEMNYKVLDRGRFKNKIGLRSIVSKDPYVYSFRILRNGDIAAIVQRILGLEQLDAMRATADGEVAHPTANYAAKPQGSLSGVAWSAYEYPPLKFLVGTYRPLYNNPFGNSDLRAAYRAFFIKDWAWKFRSIFMEKWGAPTAMGTFPNGTPESRKNELLAALESIQQETSIVIPQDMKVELLKVATTGNVTEYERSIADLNKEILVGLLGSFLAVEEGKKTGARAQGQVHLWIAKLFIEALVWVTENVLNRQLVRRLVDMNYPVEKYPKVRFELSRVDELLAEAELDEALQRMGAVISPEYIQKKYGRPVKAMAKVTQPVGGTDGEEDAPPDEPPVVHDVPAHDNGGDPLDPVFRGMRAGALPEDAKKLGRLREMYTHVIHAYMDLSQKAVPDADRLAFELAGDERKFYAQHGRWMNPTTAYIAFKEKVAR